MKTELRGEGLLIQDTDVDIVIMCDKYRRRKEKKDSIIASSNQWKDLEKYVQGSIWEMPRKVILSGRPHSKFSFREHWQTVQQSEGRPS